MLVVLSCAPAHPISISVVRAGQPGHKQKRKHIKTTEVVSITYYIQPPWSILNLRISGPLYPAPCDPPRHPTFNVGPANFFCLSVSPARPQSNLESGGPGGGARTKNTNLKLSIDQGWPQGTLMVRASGNKKLENTLCGSDLTFGGARGKFLPKRTTGNTKLRISDGGTTFI